MRWFDTQSAAVILGVTRKTIGVWCKTGKIRYVMYPRKFGKSIRFRRRIPETALVEFLEVEWGHDQKKYPDARPVTLDHLIEYGLKSGSIAKIEEIPEPDEDDVSKMTPKRYVALIDNLTKANEARGVKPPRIRRKKYFEQGKKAYESDSRQRSTSNILQGNG